MNKIKITLEIQSRRRNERRTSKSEKLVNAIVRLWKATLTSDLRPSAKFKLLRQIVVSGTLLVLAYLFARLLPLILNHP